jgi:hypothetical protein
VTASPGWGGDMAPLVSQPLLAALVVCPGYFPSSSFSWSWQLETQSCYMQCQAMHLLHCADVCLVVFQGSALFPVVSMSVHVMSSCSTIFSLSEYAECSILMLVSGSPCGLGFGMPRFRNLCLHIGSTHCCSHCPNAVCSSHCWV